MQYRPLGRTGLHVSAVGLGGNQFGRTCDAAQTARLVHRALDLGVTFIDSAEMYGNGASEEVLGKALAGRWNEVIIATKTGAGNAPGKLSRRSVLSALDGSLRRLGTDHVDLYYLHFQDPTTPLEETLRAYEDAVRAGKVRYVGISNHAAWQVAEAVGIAQRHDWHAPAVSQVRYNLLDREAEAEMVPACEHLRLSIVPYLPLAGGFLTGKYLTDAPPPPDTRFGRRSGMGSDYLTPERFEQVERYRAFAQERGHTPAELAIAWLLARPVVCSVITGVTTPEQVEANVKAEAWQLTLDEVRLLG